jgi:hypothetical protein
MGEWVWLDHPDTEAPPQRFPNDPSVVAVQKARGWVVTEAPDATPPAATIEPDEVDDHGQGWVNLQHRETGGYGRFPIEAAGPLRDQGWESVAALRSPKRKPAGKKAGAEPVGDDTKEK